ncbi:MAG: hypothetical protein JKY37_12050 [Nannocystaceae bacterium]|nr:hypothetical protein [Nannocystaceae bacterium]
MQVVLPVFLFTICASSRNSEVDEAGRGSEAYILGAKATLQFPDLRPDVWGQLDAKG